MRSITLKSHRVSGSSGTSCFGATQARLTTGRNRRTTTRTGPPASPWENGYIESFNGKLRDELLDGEIFYSLKEAQVVVEMWRREYNHERPHSALGMRPPAPEAVVPLQPGYATLRPDAAASRGALGLT